MIYKQIEIYHSQFWRSGSPRSRHQEIQGPFLIDGAFLLCSHMMGDAKKLTEGL
jgi:hypothetical protein